MTEFRFATFWHGGELSRYELACLLSFPRRGYELTVYTYGQINNLPGEIRIADAREILPPDTTSLFAVDGKPSYAHFTDYFRFVLFSKTDQIWVDTDILLLNRFDERCARNNLMGRESPTSVCTAVLRLDPHDQRLGSMVEQVETLAKKKLRWGETGPRLLTSVYGVESGLPESAFYPVHFDDYYKVFLPQFRDECQALCRDAFTLHLWNNLVVKMGLFKTIGPPVGSFLHDVFENDETNRLFDVFYPESVMKAMVHNAVHKVGGDAGIRKVIALVAPSIRSTIARRWPQLGR